MLVWKMSSFGGSPHRADQHPSVMNDSNVDAQLLHKMITETNAKEHYESLFWWKMDQSLITDHFKLEMTTPTRNYSGYKWRENFFDRFAVLNCELFRQDFRHQDGHDLIHEICTKLSRTDYGHNRYRDANANHLLTKRFQALDDYLKWPEDTHAPRNLFDAFCLFGEVVLKNVVKHNPTVYAETNLPLEFWLPECRKLARTQFGEDRMNDVRPMLTGFIMVRRRSFSGF